METTLTIDDTVMKALRREEVASGRTMSSLVEMALRMLLRNRGPLADVPELPGGSGHRVVPHDLLAGPMRTKRLWGEAEAPLPRDVGFAGHGPAPVVSADRGVSPMGRLAF